MSTRIILLLSILFIGTALIIIAITIPKSTEPLDNIIQDTSELIPLAQEIITPPPLRGPTENITSNLTVAGTFTATNQQRITNNKKTLARNFTLDSAAQNKVNDMFAKQYFEHVSPDGTSVSDVVEAVGYEYIAVGENLALGNYVDDAALVQAWMDSPGHRESILKEGFTEVGIAVKRGTFEGRQTWLAVQTFGTPVSECSLPSNALDKQIETNTTKLDILKVELITTETFEKELQKITDIADQGNAKIAEGNKEIETGNEVLQETKDQSQAQTHWDKGEALQQDGRTLINEAKEKQTDLQSDRDVHTVRIKEFNNLVETTQEMIEDYNNQVREFNACAKKIK